MKFLLWFICQVLEMAFTLLATVLIGLPLFVLYYGIIIFNNIFKPYKEYEEYTG